MIKEIREELFQLRDENYKSFQNKLIPNVKTESFIGVRTPELRKMAKNLARREGIEVFLRDLPHRYFDENQLHAFIIAEKKDYGQCLEEVKRFLPYIDNWATCDQLSPKVFKKNHISLIQQIRVWIASEETYTVRFGIGMLMQHFLDADFDSAYPEMVAEIKSEEYYVQMMKAWYFATALAKQYAAVLPFLEEQRLDIWTHNKTIQKAVESFRIAPERKEYLKSLKRSRGETDGHSASY